MVNEKVLQFAGTVLFNVSLSTGHFLDSFKHTIMIPLLKKYNLEKSSLKNYRPVSKMPFLSKLLERVIQTQLQRHLDINRLVPPLIGLTTALKQFC